MDIWIHAKERVKMSICLVVYLPKCLAWNVNLIIVYQYIQSQERLINFFKSKTILVWYNIDIAKYLVEHLLQEFKSVLKRLPLNIRQFVVVESCSSRIQANDFICRFCDRWLYDILVDCMPLHNAIYTRCLLHVSRHTANDV